MDAYNAVREDLRMKIDQNKLKAIAAMPDDAMWREIVAAAKKHGFELPERTPPHEELEKMRLAVSGGRMNLTGAIKILDKYRKGKGS